MNIMIMVLHAKIPMLTSAGGIVGAGAGMTVPVETLVVVAVTVTGGLSPWSPSLGRELSLCWAPANSPTKMELRRRSISATIKTTLVRGVKGSWTIEVIRSANEGSTSPSKPASSRSGSRRSGADSTMDLS
jgi:hypothetical protein